MPRPLPKPPRWPAAASRRIRPRPQPPTLHVHGGALTHRPLAAGAASAHLGLPAQLLPSSQPKRRIPALPSDGTPASGSARLFPDPLGCFRIGAEGRRWWRWWGDSAEPRRRRSSGCGARVPPLSRAARPRSRASLFPGRHDGSLEDLRQSSLKLACLSRLYWSLRSGTTGLSPGGRGSRPPPSLRSAALPPQPGSRYSETLPSPPSTSAPRARAGSAF